MVCEKVWLILKVYVVMAWCLVKHRIII